MTLQPPLVFALGHPGGRACLPPHGTAGAPDDDNGYWVLPAADQERQILADWAAFVPHPAFDYAYSRGSQLGDTALSQSPDLRAIFAEKNASGMRPNSS